MTSYALVVVLATNIAWQVPVTWHPTRDRCERQLAVEVTVLALRGQPVVSAHCQPQRTPQPPPMVLERQR